MIGTTRPYSGESLQLGTILKLTRVSLLLPVILLLEAARLWESMEGSVRGAGRARHFPWFVAGFAGVVALNFLLPVPSHMLSTLRTADTWILAVSMAAMGLENSSLKTGLFRVEACRAGISLRIFAGVAGLLLSSLLYGHVY